MDDQLSLFTEYESTRAEREAIVRGALFLVGTAPRDVPGLALLCRAIWEAEGSQFPPTIEDLHLQLGPSVSTIKRQLQALASLGIVKAERDASASARDPKRRVIDWERTAQLARREAPTVVVEARPLAHREPTSVPLGQGEPTRANESQRNEAAGSLFLDIYPPTPKTIATEGAAAGEKFERPEAAEPSGPTWAEVEAIVAATGIGDRHLLRRARGRGVAAAEVAKLVEVWRSQDGVGPGVLHGRIDQHQAGASIAGFVAAEPVEFKLQRIQKRSDVGRAERERIVEATTAAIDERVRRAALEAEHGAAIDAASQAELIEVANRTGRGFVVKALQKPGGRGSTVVRAELLAAWAEVHEAAASGRAS